MQIKSLLLAAAAATSALAMPNLSARGNNVPGYPWNWNPWCMNDAQAQFIVNQFYSILTNQDRQGAIKTATGLLANSFSETSDSINVLAGYPVSDVPQRGNNHGDSLTHSQQGGPSFNGKQAYITGVGYAPAIPSMTTLDVWHDCDTIGWQWVVNNLARNVSPVKGFNKFMIDPSTGLVQSSNLEFNSIAWGEDLGGTWTAPPAQSQ